MGIKIVQYIGRDSVERISFEKSEEQIVRNARLKAYELFEKLPLDESKYGTNIKADMNELLLSKVHPNKISVKDKFDIRADKNVIVDDINKALKTNQEVKKYFMRNVVINDKITAMNSAFWNNGRVIYIPPKTTLRNPIKILLKVNSKNSIWYLLIIIDSLSDVSIIEDISNQLNHSVSNNLFSSLRRKNLNQKNLHKAGRGGWIYRKPHKFNIETYVGDYISSKEDNQFSYHGGIVEIVLKGNSRLHYSSVQNLSKDYFNFVNKTVVVEKDSTMNWFDCCIGSKFTKSESNTLLNGEGAVTNNYGMFFGSASQLFDLSGAIIHAERNTKCNMLIKGALADRARAIYRGLIKINSNAGDSNGYLKEDAILLSQDAEIDCIPQLEIENNEVTCTHGATVSQVDKEKVFYLMSRGLPENVAKKKIVEGFFEPMIERIEVEDIKGKVREIVDEKIRL